MSKPAKRYEVEGQLMTLHEVSAKYAVEKAPLLRKIKYNNIQEGDDIFPILQMPDCTGHFGDQLVPAGNKTILIDNINRHLADDGMEAILEYMDRLLAEGNSGNNKAMKEYIELCKWASPKPEAIRDPKPVVAIQQSFYTAVPSPKEVNV